MFEDSAILHAIVDALEKDIAAIVRANPNNPQARFDLIAVAHSRTQTRLDNFRCQKFWMDIEPARRKCRAMADRAIAQ